MGYKKKIEILIRKIFIPRSNFSISTNANSAKYDDTNQSDHCPFEINDVESLDTVMIDC